MAVVIVKSSKMRKDRQLIDTIPIPHLDNAYICPVKALNLMLSHIPQVKDDPLFQIPTLGHILPLTDSQARKHLQSVCQHLNLVRRVTFHDFRRGGVTWPFRHGVSVEHIQVQGTWSSQCVWHYIQLPLFLLFCSF